MALLTAVGEDTFGERALRLWEAEGVDASAVLRVPAPTMAGAILVEPGGENRIVIVPGALAALEPRHVDAFAPAIAAADVLLVQLEIPLATALHALRVGRQADVLCVLDPAPAPASPLAAEADYLTPNEREAAAVAGSPGRLVLTLGERGAQLAEELVPAFPAEPVDTTGAGDAFAAAFAVALAEGAGELEAARFACAAGAHMVEHHGVVPGLPTRAEREARLHAQAR